MVLFLAFKPRRRLVIVGWRGFRSGGTIGVGGDVGADDVGEKLWQGGVEGGEGDGVDEAHDAAGDSGTSGSCGSLKYPSSRPA